MSRTFEDTPAVREQTPILLGFVGPSGTGKTFSALRVATGIQRVCGGDIHVIDTESKRALHYAPKKGEAADPSRGTYSFRHLNFGAPFGPLDYLAAFEHCIARGARTIIVDSMSHEHEGQGGVLEQHSAELDRMAGQDYRKRNAMQGLAWGKPKRQRVQLINAMLQMPCNFLMCFRAKPKLKWQKGQEPEQLGWMPIAGSEFVYEMILKFLFLPGARGVPVWQSEYEGEREMIKIPTAFTGLFGKPEQLTERHGEAIAQWAVGGEAGAGVDVGELVVSYQECANHAELEQLEERRKFVWTQLSRDAKSTLRGAVEAAQQRLQAAVSNG